MAFAGRGGYGGGMTGNFGGFPRGGFGGGRGGFGFGNRGGFAGGAGGAGGFEAAPVAVVPPNPFTDNATAGTERSETIYVRNVSGGLLPASYSLEFNLIFIQSNLSYSCHGQQAMTILLNYLQRLAKLSRLRSNMSRVEDLVVPVW